MKILCFDIKYVGFSNNKKWKCFVRENRHIDAIKAYRDSKGFNKHGEYNVSLVESKKAVDDYHARLMYEKVTEK